MWRSARSTITPSRGEYTKYDSGKYQNNTGVQPSMLYKDFLKKELP